MKYAIDLGHEVGPDRGAYGYLAEEKIIDEVGYYVIKKLKDLGYWIVATDMEGMNYTEIDYKTKIGLVIGNEGKGISKVTKDNCDYISKIPMKGTVNSLNASVACGIFLSEINRSRGE